VIEPIVVAGIDLSGRTTGTTALAIAEHDGHRLRVREVHAHRRLRGAFGDVELIERCRHAHVEVVAIDAPLGLPHAVACEDPACETCFGPRGPGTVASRECESAAAWRAVGHAEKPPMAAALLAAISYRAIHLARRFRRAGIACHETWPMGTYRALLRPGGHSGPVDDGARHEALRQVVEGVAEALDADGIRQADRRDALDAVAAAYAAWAIAFGGATAVGNPDEGLIWFAGPAA
jgi:predicted nuclease with RNAse H fold